MNEMPTFSLLRDLEQQVGNLTHWLREEALPLWFRTGLDMQHGGFFETIEQNGKASKSANRRSRVTPRQIYCFASAGSQGFLQPDDDWETVCREALDWYERVYQTHTGFFGNVASPEAELIDVGFDLYNQAFALFAYAELARAMPDQKSVYEAKAAQLLSKLFATHKHPVSGFEEAAPTRLPLCSNPHMHLLEACLSWEEVASAPERWTVLADEIAQLALNHFIDSQTGALREFFNHDWTPYSGEEGRIVEPGHQFEWAWLLARWGILRKNARALKSAERLFDIGCQHGICPNRQVAIMQLYDDFSDADPIARLWPQTEWLKAACLLAQHADGSRRERYLSEANRACRALTQFLQTETPGLWRDKANTSGSFISEPAPASTFYHIVCAVYQANATLREIPANA